MSKRRKTITDEIRKIDNYIFNNYEPFKTLKKKYGGRVLRALLTIGYYINKYRNYPNTNVLYMYDEEYDEQLYPEIIPEIKLLAKKGLLKVWGFKKGRRIIITKIKPNVKKIGISPIRLYDKYWRLFIKIGRKLKR